jgi:hypothetical protein
MKIIEKKKIQESSFMVGQATLNDVYWLIEGSKKASAIVMRTIRGKDLFHALRDLNILALTGRYAGNKPEQMFAGAEKYRVGPDKSSFVQKFKSLQSLVYQCSEDPADKEPLYKALEAIKELRVSDFIEDTVEYDRAYWGD